MPSRWTVENSNTVALVALPYHQIHKPPFPCCGAPPPNKPTQGVIFLAHHPISEMERVTPSLQAGAAGPLLF